MSVKIRLTRMGKKKQPSYRVVVMDSRKPRDGKYIEQIGRYDPRQDPSLIEIDNDKAVGWLTQGAQPTDRAKKLLEISGAWTQFRVARGDIHTVADEPAADEGDEGIEVLEVVTPEPGPDAATEPTATNGEAEAGSEVAATGAAAEAADDTEETAT